MPDVFNVMISQDWDPEEDEWKGIDIKNIEFADTGAWAATPNCDDTPDTWGPICKPCKPRSESSLPDLEPITPPHSPTRSQVIVLIALSSWKSHHPPLVPPHHHPATLLPRHGSRPFTPNAECQPPLEDVVPPSADWSRSPRWSPCSHAGIATSSDTRSCSAPISTFPEFVRLKVSALLWSAALAPLMVNRPPCSLNSPMTWRSTASRKSSATSRLVGPGSRERMSTSVAISLTMPSRWSRT
jgi:hypothetical protein